MCGRNGPPRTSWKNFIKIRIAHANLSTNKIQKYIYTEGEEAKGKLYIDHVQTQYSINGMLILLSPQIWLVCVNVSLCSETNYIFCEMLQNTSQHIKNHLTGRFSLIIPDLATAILSNEPPSAARCSAPTFVMIETARSELIITLVASRAPPNPAYRLAKEIKFNIHFEDDYLHLSQVSLTINYKQYFR